jgi:hypothetical protein
MGRNNGDFNEGSGHKWVPGVNEYDERIEVSDTPAGKYTISGRGAGPMKWSVTNEAANYEALGRRRSEVRAEADLHLKSNKKEEK